MNQSRPSERPCETAGGDAGSTSVELAVLLPVLLSVVLLLIAGLRVGHAHLQIQQAARDAARTASLARDPGDAAAQAQAAAAGDLASAPGGCTAVAVNTDTTGFNVPVGQPAQVTVQVSCTVPLADLLLPGLPGGRTLTARAVSPLDTYRAR